MGKQRVEVLQILNILINNQTESRYYNHPAVKMFKGYENALVLYGQYICQEWTRRGYEDSCYDKISRYYDSNKPLVYPPWFGNQIIHQSHRGRLVEKYPGHYRDILGWKDEPTLEYVWPT